ncbi:hypothetical protein MKX01_029369 [Papaver californicum]|nr:hypothetical protein MKX01_029369 [Papaver californicum]
MALALSFEAEVKCSAYIFYGLFKNNITELKNLFPEICENIHVIEGHGPSISSVRLWKCRLGVVGFATAKDKMAAVNNELKSITWSTEGDATNFEIKLVSVTLTGEGSFLVIWSVTFKNTNQDVQFPTAFMNYVHMLTVGLPYRLLKQG